MRRLFAIGLVWVGCGAAWMILGSTLVVRSGDASADLGYDVHQLWGPPATQHVPSASFSFKERIQEERTSYAADGTPVATLIEREVEKWQPIALTASDLRVDLALEHRRKGLMWFPTYEVDFQGSYRFENDSDAARTVHFRFPLDQRAGVYDDFVVSDAGGADIAIDIADGTASWTRELEAGEKINYTVAYATRGTESWHYHLGAGTHEVRNFRLQITTDDADIDFPIGTISPSRHGPTPEGWAGTWEFRRLISNSPIGVSLPQKLNPGPLASRITFFAPVSLLFFFFVVAVLAEARTKRLHPMHYFFLGCAFFAFHLLFAYLVDHLAILPSFGIAAVVSVFLVVTYARLFVGWGFALREMAIAQLLYLVLFSYTFFWEGFTGLAVTIGAILTLFVMMQITGRLDWSASLAKPPSGTDGAEAA